MFNRLKNHGYRYQFRIGVALVLLLSSINVHAVVAVDNVSSVLGINPTTLTVSHATAGSDRLMIVGVSLRNDDNEFVTSVTYNGTGLSFIGQVSNGDDARVELWSYVNPPATTANVVVTFNEDVRRNAGLGVITFTGVDQINPFGGFQSNTGRSTTANAAVVSAAGETVLGVMAARQVDANPAVVGGTERWTYKTQGGNNRSAGAGATFSGAPSVSMSWNLTDNREWAVGAISIREVGAVVLACDTFRDEFTSPPPIYSRQDGTVNWSTDWIEVGDDGTPNGGDIRVRNNDSLRLEGDGSAVTVLGGPFIQREANLAGYSSASLSFDYRETGNWEPSDDIEIYVSDDGGASWNLIQTFSDDQGNTFQNFSTDISAYISSNTRIAFVEKANQGNEDFFFDNVQISACRPALLAYYQMDESIWNGTANEVIDSSTSGNDGTAVGSATTVNPGKVCLGGDIPFNNSDAAQDAVDTGLDMDSGIGIKGTISFWYNSDTAWTGGGDRMLVDASTTADNKYFFVALLNTGVLRFRFEDSADADFQLDTTAKAFPAGEWHHIAITWDLPADRLEIYIDGLLDASLTPNTSGSWGALGTVYLGDNRSTYHPSGTPNSANGIIDEARIYAVVQTAAGIQADMNATHACPVTLDHFRITPATTAASTCLPDAVTIVAEDAANNPITTYTSTVNISTSTNHGNWSVNTASNVTNPNPDNDDNGAVDYSFLLADAGDIILDLTNTRAETLTVTVADAGLGVSSTSVAITYADNVFIITEDPVQVAGRPQAMNVAMWTNDGANCFIDTGYNYNPQNLEASIDRGGVLPVANDPEIGGVPIPDGPATGAISLDFSVTPGQAGFNLDTNDVGQYRLTIRDVTNTHGSGVITGDSSLLTVRPFGIAVTGIMAGATPNPGGTAPADPVFTAAGGDFEATVAGVLWSAADDTDNDGVLDTGVYANNALAPSYAWDTTLGVSGVAASYTPSAGTPGVLNNATIMAAEFGAGAFNVTDLQYTEVGSFTLQSSATGFLGEPTADIVGDDIIIGRFIPASFAVTIDGDGVLAESCSAFTYMGQDFSYDTAPTITVTAQNVQGATTAQYRDTFVKLDGSSVTVDASQDDTTAGSDTNPLLVSYDVAVMTDTPNNNGTVTYTFGADTFRYGPDAPLTTFSKSGNSQVAPFVADINPEISSVSEIDVTTNYAPGTYVLDPTGNNLRFGRLRMDNVHGSELNPLLMPVFTEFWNGTSFQRNILDTCTTIADADLIPVASPPGLSIPSIVNAPASAGDVDLNFPSPGAGNDGYVDTTTDLNSAAHLWLRFDWNGDGVFDDDPFARATFGIFDGDPVQIYIQQIYE